MTQAEPEGPQSPSRPKLPLQTVERWRQIVTRAAHNGTDVSTLVQHFAERAFENKTAGLDSQGARRRALAQHVQVMSRELKRATAALANAQAQKQTDLRPHYSGVALSMLPIQKKGDDKRPLRTRNAPMALDHDTQSTKTSPLAQKLTTVSGLAEYVATMTSQKQTIEQEIAAVDAVLNQGMANRESTVAELSATTAELWRIAQEVLREIGPIVAAGPPARTDALPKPLSDEKTAALQPSEQKSDGGEKKPNDSVGQKAIKTGHGILRNVQSFFTKKGD